MKQLSLVCQYLENISREALEKYQDIVKDYFRNRQGIYALYRNGKLYYVGLASNLNSRLGQHLKDRHKESWDRFSAYFTIGDSHMKELESLILRVIKPAGNKLRGKFINAESLKRRLGADIDSRFKKKLSSIMGEELKQTSQTKQIDRNVKKHAGRKAILSEYIKRAFVLRSKFKGKMILARVRKDGMITFKGKIYSSPSLAAAEACERPTSNGWDFWQYERAPGDWVKLNELRR